MATDSVPSTTPKLATLAPRLSPWRFVVSFGVISMLSDVVYEGARAVTGPLLAGLGATALVVGIVTGAGEAAALVLRLGSGVWADRTQRFWGFTIAGYALTVASVPLLGFAAVLWVACALVIAERVGKAIRSPAKDTLLSHATAGVGRGRGFAVHEALDQIGAVTGPLLVAAVLAATGSFRPALLSLAVPGVVVLGLLLWLRATVPHPAAYETTASAPTSTPASAPTKRAGATRATTATEAAPASPGLPGRFWAYAGFTALTMSGFATFGVLSFHLATRHVVPDAAIPVVYAAAMGVDAVAALASGYLYDRHGARVLAALPVLAAAVPVLAFAPTPATAITGSLLWGAALGVQESTMRAQVADLTPPARRATAYGIFAAVYGGATIIGGVLAGALYARSVPALAITTGVIQVLALIVLAVIVRRSSGRRARSHLRSG